MSWLWLVLVFGAGFISGFFVMFYAVKSYIHEKLIPEIESAPSPIGDRRASGR